MDFEVEFHPVGDASRAGDAISVRYGFNGSYEVMVIDGGTEDSGAALVTHISNFYGPDTTITHMISTHPDSDHASGLREVMRNFHVDNLWVHGLWSHASEMLPYFEDKRWTVAGLEKQILGQYPIIQELLAMAAMQGTIVHEPFEGQMIGPFVVLSPTKWAYQRLVPQFRKTPAPDEQALRREQMWLGERPVPSRAAGLLANLVEAARGWADEHWNIELLREGAITAAENETSTVLYANFGSQSVLLTADAGVNALSWACNCSDRTGIDLTAVSLIQVPHHGSRSNVTPSILDRLLGAKLPEGAPIRRHAVVSAPKDDEKHPRKMVINAFTRRGSPVCATQGFYYRHHSQTMPYRGNETPAVPFNFFSRVEDYD